MDISCDVIRDLLPLYAEDLTSEASSALVDEHLCKCDPCTKQLSILKKAQVIPVDVEVKSLKRVGDTIRRRRVLAVMTALLFIITVVVGGMLLLDAKIYLTAEQAVDYVEALDDGGIRVHWSDDILIAGTCSLGNGDPNTDELTGNYGIIVWSPLSNVLFPRERLSYEEMLAQLPEDIQPHYTKEEYNTKTYYLEGNATSQNFWYCSAKDGTGEKLLWDAGNPAPDGPFVDVNYHIAYYCVILLVLSVILVFPGKKFCDKWYGELCSRASIFFGSLCLSVVIVTAGQFMELYGEFAEAFSDSLAVAVPMTLTALLARQLHKLNKQDKGQ